MPAGGVSQESSILADALGRLQADDHADAIRLCLVELTAALQGSAEVPRRALRLIQDSASSWAKWQRKQISNLEDEKGSMTSQLNGLREKCDMLKSAKEAKDRQLQDLNRELLYERQERHRFEEHSQNRLAAIVKLQQQLRRSEEARARQKPAEPSRQDVVRHLARMECEALLQAEDDVREKLKKKLLLKWHPDKQPSAAHSSLATQVMQEMQNRAEWTW